jgi:hypothetical protein
MICLLKVIFNRDFDEELKNTCIYMFELKNETLKPIILNDYVCM